MQQHPKIHFREFHQRKRELARLRLHETLQLLFLPRNACLMLDYKIVSCPTPTCLPVVIGQT